MSRRTIHAASPTTISLDNKLVRAVVLAGKHKSKKAAVVAALKEYVDRRSQPDILDLVGKIDFDPEYDYKAQRRRQRCL